MSCSSPTRVVPRPPNRPAHERQMESLQTRSSAQEERRRFLQDRLRQLREHQGRVRSEKESIGEDRSLTDEKLNSINKEVEAKRDQVQKLRAGLPYLNEDSIHDQISNLEYQLRKHNFKPPEEKKIVVEIDKLNRSKKLLKDHNILKMELDQLRTSQRTIREHRDRLFRQRGELNKAEVNLKRDTKEIRDELDKIKVEAEELNNERRAALAEFRALEAEHKRYLWERREEQRNKRREEKEAAEFEKTKEIEEIKANSEPYDEEMKLISNLISYCLRFEFPTTAANNGPTPMNHLPPAVCNGLLAVPNPNPRRGSHESGLKQQQQQGNNLQSGPGSTNSSTYATPIGATPVSTPAVENKGFVYKKDDNDDALFAGVAKKTSRKNSRNERRNSRAKLLNHNPEIYAQFGQFGFNPPASTKDVVNVIDCLRAKQQYYENLSCQEKSGRLEGGQSAAKAVPPSLLDLKIEYQTPSVLVNDGQGDDEQLEDDADNNMNLEEAFPSLPQRHTPNGSGFFDSDEQEKTDTTSSRKEYSSSGNNLLLTSLTDNLKKDLQLSEEEPVQDL